MPDVTIEKLLSRIYIFLEDEEWAKAEEYCERVLDAEPYCAEAYFCKLMAEFKVRHKDGVFSIDADITVSKAYRNALRFGDDDLKQMLNDAAKSSGYRYALMLYNNASTGDDFNDAATAFDRLSDYRDSVERAVECRDKAAAISKDAVYNGALVYMKRGGIDDLKKALKALDTISGWRESEKLSAECHDKIQMLTESAEKNRIIEEKRKKTVRLLKIIICMLLAVVLIFAAVYVFYIRPENCYDKALAYYNRGEYEASAKLFSELGGYRDSETKTVEARYAFAKTAFEDGMYELCISQLELTKGFKDSDELLKDAIYLRAGELMEGSKYIEASELYGKIPDYNDSGERIKECDYRYATWLFNEGNYKTAIAYFSKLKGYRDGSDKLSEAGYLLAGEYVAEQKFDDAISLYSRLGDFRDSPEKLKAAIESAAISEEDACVMLEEYAVLEYPGAKVGNAYICAENADDYLLGVNIKTEPGEDFEYICKIRKYPAEVIYVGKTSEGWHTLKGINEFVKGASYTAGTGVSYWVRKSPDDIKSQIGAFTVFDNAKKLVDRNPGYHVYDSYGNIVY